MADNHKYYYLKLKENFFDTEEMKLLQSVKDGYLYSDIYMKLCLLSLKQDGRLMYRGMVPYSAEMISAITGHSAGVVEKGIGILEQMGFVEVLDNGAIYMIDIQNFIGQSSTEADRKRNYRKIINAEKSRLSENNNGTFVETKSGTDDGQMSDESIPEIRDKSIEIRDIDNNTIVRSSGTQISEPEADVEALILNDGSEWRPTEALYAEYVRLFPNLDVKRQFKLMRSWCLSNPTKRKTKRGITRFVNSWLANEQDQGYRRQGGNGSTQQSQSESGYSQDTLNRLINENRGDLNGARV